MQLTELELDVLLNGFGKSDFFEHGLDSCVWSDDLESNTKKAKGKQISGIVSSLTKKGIMESTGEGRESYVYLTDEGKEIFSSLVSD